MKSRGAPSTRWRHPWLVIVASLVACLCVLGARGQLNPQAQGWILQYPEEPTTVGALASAAMVGRFTFLFGGLSAAVAPSTSLQQFIQTSIGQTPRAINYVDVTTTKSGVPMTLPVDRYPPPWRNVSTNITNNASSWIPAQLPAPSIGPNNVAVVGTSIFSLAMCNAIPGEITIDFNSTADVDFFRTGWVVTVVTDASGIPTPPKNTSNSTSGFDDMRKDDPYPAVPRVQVTPLHLGATVTPRFNASCVAHGTNVYIIGGLQIVGGESFLTASVAVYDTLRGRYTDSAWTHNEAVANPGVASDDSFLYIVGGQMSDGGVSFKIDAHYIASNVAVYQSAYPPPVYNFPIVSVINGIITITGSPMDSLQTFAVWSMRLRNGFGVTSGEAPLNYGGVLTAVATTQNISLALFGGVTSSGPNPVYYQSTLEFGESMWQPTVPTSSLDVGFAGLHYFANASTPYSPTWLPNNNGNITALVDGYTVLWANFTFSVLFDNASIASMCNPSSEPSGTYCSVRIARSPRCDDPYVADVPFTTASMKHLTLHNKAYIAVGPFAAITQSPSDNGGSGSESSSSGGSATPPPIADTSSEDLGDSTTTGADYVEPLFAYVCFSVAPYAVPKCVGDPEISSNCEAYFYTPLTQLSPFMVYSFTSIPSPSPQSAPSPTKHFSLYIGIGAGALLFLMIVGVVLYRRNHATEVGDYDDDDGEGDTASSFLSNNRRSKSPSPKKQSQQGGQSQQTGSNVGLLDGKYRFVQRLGKGSFSIVYLVERVTDRQRFALKYVQIGDDTDRHEAMKECEVVHKLQGHPNVIHLYDMFMSYRFDTNLVENLASSGHTINSSRKSPSPQARYFDTTNFGVRVDDDNAPLGGSNRQVSGERFLGLVMEYHERGDLGKWVKRQKGDPRVPEATILSIAFQTLSVLNYMHQGNQPIIHRDLKPENILLSSVVYENMSSSFLPIVITDFGLSRVMDKTFCETGVGSLPYVAPECWQRCYSTKVDIWAVGCILYAVCAKRVEPDNVKVMFSESSRGDFYRKLFQEINTVYGYSKECAKFIVTLLDVDPNNRPSAADALKRMKKRQALPSSMLRKELSGLDSELLTERVYDSKEMGKDAQCEFFIPTDMSFGSLSNGWNLDAPTTYGTTNDALGMLTSGPLPRLRTTTTTSSDGVVFALPTPPLVSPDASMKTIADAKSVEQDRPVPLPQQEE